MHLLRGWFLLVSAGNSVQERGYMCGEGSGCPVCWADSCIYVRDRQGWGVAQSGIGHRLRFSGGGLAFSILPPRALEYGELYRVFPTRRTAASNYLPLLRM